MPRDDEQPPLFAVAPGALPAAPAHPGDVEVARRLPSRVRLGTTSWAYPGWIGLVYGAGVAPKHLAEWGLTAYARHPLLRAVEIDRTYYEPLAPGALRSFAEQVPEDFRFVVKAHEDCVVARFPTHARYGKKRGLENPLYLDASYASDAVVAPFVEGLGAKGGVLLFQFPPQDAGGPGVFAERLGGFLARLPQGPTYAVEIRNTELLTPEYVRALEDAGAVHCHNVWGRMPSVAGQARRVAPGARRPLVVRWIVRAGGSFEEARARYEPFDRLVDEDATTRSLVADLVGRAADYGVPSLVMIDNKAEGCAPESAWRLARAIVDRSG